MGHSTTKTAAVLRTAIKARGIKARVRAFTACGDAMVQVITPTYDARFTPDEIEAFCTVARDAGLTLVQGMPIDPVAHRQLSERNQWSFFA